MLSNVCLFVSGDTVRFSIGWEARVTTWLRRSPFKP